MDKILDVIRKITDNANLISQVMRSDDELYFTFADSFKFSLRKGVGEFPYYFHLYPDTKMSIEDIMNVDWSYFKDYLTYNSNETGEEELYDNLYKILASKLYNADKIINEILGL